MNYIQRIKELEAKNKEYEAKINQLQEDNKLKDIKIENMNLTLNKYRKMIFGPGKERTPEGFAAHDSAQLSFFCDTEEQEQVIGEIQKAVKEITIKPHKRKINKAGIRQDKLKDFDFEIEEYELKDGEKCDVCNSDMIKVGRKLVRQNVKYIRAKLAVVSIFQNTYQCKNYGNEDSKNANDHFAKAPIPRPLLNHS